MRKRSVCLLFHVNGSQLAVCIDLHRYEHCIYFTAQHRRAFRSTARSVNTAAISRSLMT